MTIALFLYSALLVGLSVLPAAAAPPLYPGLDKVAHAAAYAVLYVLAQKGMAGRAVRVWVWAVAYCAFLGAVTEFLQFWVPGRYCSGADWAADMAGAVASAVFLRRNGLRGGHGTFA